MSDYIGNITVPEIAVSGTFAIVPDYPHGRAQRQEVVIHQFGSGNAKIDQRFLMGTGAKRFTVRRTWMNDTDRIAIRDFWESHGGSYGAFTSNAPNHNGIGTTPYTCILGALRARHRGGTGLLRLGPGIGGGRPRETSPGPPGRKLLSAPRT